MMLPPATPTAGREYFAQFQIRRPHITPINGFVSVDLDESLTSRFNKVELIGTGEFSQVYRVTQSVAELLSKHIKGLWHRDCINRYKYVYPFELAWNPFLTHNAASMAVFDSSGPESSDSSKDSD